MPWPTERQATVQVHGDSAALVNADCFHHPSLPVELLLSNYLCSFPIYLVVLLVYMGCYAIVHVKLHHCLLMFIQSLLHCPTCFSNIHFLTVLTGYLIYHSFLSVICYPVLYSHQGLSDGSVWFENCSQVCRLN